MLDGKLRMAPTCYHVLHLIPVMAAHEMNYFYDEGLRTDSGQPAYHISCDSMVPFGLEKLGIAQAMKEKAMDIALDVQTRTMFFQRSKGAASAISGPTSIGRSRCGCARRGWIPSATWKWCAGFSTPSMWMH
jgi:hypothetical protein